MSRFHKDRCQHVKVLYADYCGLRDELLRLLAADWAPIARENHED